MQYAPQTNLAKLIRVLEVQIWFTHRLRLSAKTDRDPSKAMSCDEGLYAPGELLIITGTVSLKMPSIVPRMLARSRVCYETAAATACDDEPKLVYISIELRKVSMCTLACSESSMRTVVFMTVPRRGAGANELLIWLCLCDLCHMLCECTVPDSCLQVE